jgi:hypothetical protein
LPAIPAFSIASSNARREAVMVSKFLVFALLCSSANGMFGYAQGAKRKFVITESDFVMSQIEAINFSRNVISPIVFDCAENTSEPNGLRTRMRSFIDLTRSKKMDYVPLPAYFPNREMHVLAQSARIDSKPTIILFIPEIMDSQRTMSATDFKSSVLITLAHEMIHLELGHDQSSVTGKEAAEEEAVAWAKTILEVIRPLQAKRASTSPYFAELSATFKRMKDDSFNPEWIKLFLPQ